MSIGDCLRLALASVLAHRLRSILTMLGIVIGVAAVILLTSIGDGTRRHILAEFTQFGTNLIGINPGKTTTSGMPGALGGTVRKLTIEDAEALRRVPAIERVVPMVFGAAEVSAHGRARSVFAYGVNAEAPEVFKFEVRQGQFLPPSDPRVGAPLAVLGSKLKRELFGDANALGSFVRIGAHRFRVIGIMAPKGQILGFDMDDTIWIPVKSAEDVFGREGLWEIDLLFSPGADPKEVAKRVSETLRLRHDGEIDFTITTQTEMLDILGRVLSMMNVAVGAIGSVSLLVGAIGILTMMWISVNERTSEIGLLRALGAGANDVLLLFLTEALLLSTAGGLLGIAIGAGIGFGAGALAPGLPVHVAREFVIAAVVVSLVVGLVSGVLPARRASRLDPVEALRAE